MPGVDFQTVRSLVSMAQVLDLLGFVPQESSADQRRGPCPVHGSTFAKRRSFSVNLAKNTFQCFKCGASGNQLDLWAAFSKSNLFDAALDLCN
jgi:DNA primase